VIDVPKLGTAAIFAEVDLHSTIMATGGCRDPADILLDVGYHFLGYFDLEPVLLVGSFRDADKGLH
jgi:hypothetical protein